MTKHSGADWVQRNLEQEMSPLGVKVANILGQTYLGIYHIDQEVLKRKRCWTCTNSISITIYGEMASYDASYLTLLILSCKALNVHVTLQGSFKRYIKLTFTEQDLSELSIHPTIPSTKNIMELACLYKDFDDKLLSLDEHRNSETVVSVRYLEPRLYYADALALLIRCHNQAVRVALKGRAPNGRGLGLTFSQRTREKSIMRGHPTWDEAIQNHAHLIDPLKD